jgi:hypothetical protein
MDQAIVFWVADRLVLLQRGVRVALILVKILEGDPESVQG